MLADFGLVRDYPSASIVTPSALGPWKRSALPGSPPSADAECVDRRGLGSSMPRTRGCSEALAHRLERSKTHEHHPACLAAGRDFWRAWLRRSRPVVDSARDPDR